MTGKLVSTGLHSEWKRFRETVFTVPFLPGNVFFLLFLSSECLSFAVSFLRNANMEFPPVSADPALKAEFFAKPSMSGYF